MSLQGFYCGIVVDDTSDFVVARILAHVDCVHMSFVEEDDDVAEHCISVESFVVNAYAFVLVGCSSSAAFFAARVFVFCKCLMY